ITLSQNYPNPFNPSSTIGYTLKTNHLVTLKIYDLLGRDIATLVDTNQPAGNYTVVFEAADLPSGIYFCKLIVESFIETRKMVLVR
ncbi:T9SS type A sorting domain-containing protein, partial [candidate division KSB1 bacterium]|nr:T9SS type A sorting domain-containing protein [candidate division KSB1 bacterium]